MHLLEHARWLAERHYARQASIEQRAGVIVGWGSAQAALTAAAIAITAGIGASWARTAAIALLATAALVAIAAVVIAVLGVLNTSSEAAPNSDLSELHAWIADPYVRDGQAGTLGALLGSLVSSGQVDGEHRNQVLTDMAASVTDRAEQLRAAVVTLTMALAIDGAAIVTLGLAAVVG